LGRHAVHQRSRITWCITRAGLSRLLHSQGAFVNNIIYIVGLIVVVLAILSFLGLR
jgi:small-conductance mechanosensitive channel